MSLRNLFGNLTILAIKSLLLVMVTGLILGLVFTLQSRPTLVQFSAESWIPSMISISIIREIGPVMIALICAGRIGSGIGAELGSMRDRTDLCDGRFGYEPF